MTPLLTEAANILALLPKTTPGKWIAEWNGSGVNLKVAGHMIGTMDTEWCAEEMPFITAEEKERPTRHPIAKSPRHHDPTPTQRTPHRMTHHHILKAPAQSPEPPPAAAPTMRPGTRLIAALHQPTVAPRQPRSHPDQGRKISVRE
jgi:hypothetical protein